ncbi:hypothetical protein BDR22DRAFT_889039 [Usnea florida]
MDGQPLLATLPKIHARPWPHLIPLPQLSKAHLPPFYVRLQDAQVGALAQWVSTSRSSLTRSKLGQLWPWDFDAQGRISGKRDSWGEAYDDGSGSGDKEVTEKRLGGGKKVPAWTDAGLPLTYTSSHRIMVGELEAVRKGAALKREAEEEAGREACVPVKKPRHGSVGAELKKMRESAEQTKKKGDDEKKERYLGTKPELRDAMQVVDTLMKSATEAENKNATLEDMLLKNEARYIKDTDDMFDEWLTYNEIKRKEIDRLLEDHAVEISNRNVKIKTLETNTKKLKAHLKREKHKVKKRNECLANAKSRWAQEQEFRAWKFRQIEEMEIDLDALSDFYPEADDSEDEEESGPKEAEEDTKQWKKQTSEETKPIMKPAAIGQANTNPNTMPGTTNAIADCPMLSQDNCVRTKIEVPAADQEVTMSSGHESETIEANEVDEDEDADPIPSQKRKLRSSVRSKPA